LDNKVEEDNHHKLPRKVSREKPTQSEERQSHTDNKLRRVMRERQDWLIHMEMLDVEDDL